jgi:hypothetical protein
MRQQRSPILLAFFVCKYAFRKPILFSSQGNEEGGRDEEEEAMRGSPLAFYFYKYWLGHGTDGFR